MRENKISFFFFSFVFFLSNFVLSLLVLIKLLFKFPEFLTPIFFLILSSTNCLFIFTVFVLILSLFPKFCFVVFDVEIESFLFTIFYYFYLLSPLFIDNSCDFTLTTSKFIFYF